MTNKEYWKQFNNDIFTYEFVMDCGEEWAMVFCTRIQNNKNDVGIFHLLCIEDPSFFREHMNTPNIDFDGVGAAKDDGFCDKCKAGPVEQKYIDLARFVYGDAYVEGCYIEEEDET